MTKSSGAKLAGSISFVQNHVPPFDAGTYRLVLNQEMSVADTTLRQFVQFAVAGERFRLNPDEVGTVFPPAESAGEYDNVLPHIVLTRKTLPWERTATGDAPQRDANGDVAPWLGLLVFGAADAPVVQSVKVGDLFDREDFDQSHLPTGVFSTFSRRPPAYLPRTPATELEYHEKVNDACRVIDIPLDLFNQVAPAQTDLHWLAHARLLSVPLPKQPDKTEAATVSSDFAVVFGNRLPAVGERNTAYLVSLHAAATYLPTAAGAASPDTAQQARRSGPSRMAIRLVVLRSWSFTVQPAREKNHQSFAQLIANLNDGDAHKSLLRWSRQTTSTEVNQALVLGYTALPHQTRLGDQTVSWYRGPLIPYAAERAIELPIMSADAITFYDDMTGMFDVSYAAAWQLGRLLALNNKGFATQLFTWKREVRRSTADKMVQKHLRAMAPQHENVAEEMAKRTLVQAIVTAGLRNALAHKQFDGQPSPGREERHTTKMQAVGDHDALSALHADRPRVPAALAQWLGRLMLLNGVPFNYLVADHRLLPAESLRFFRLDGDWMASLIDGANSIGRTGHADAHDRVFASYLFEQACAAAGMRSLTNISGFLLCSALVDGWWPGLKIDGFAVAEPHPDETQRLPILRLEQLAPNVLLCLFDGVVRRLDFHPPPEGLHFGLTVIDRDDDDTPVAFAKELRDSKTGEEIILASDRGDKKALAIAEIPFRGGRVLQVAQLATSLKEKLDNPQPFTSAEFAMQMIEGTQMGGFIHNGESQ